MRGLGNMQNMMKQVQKIQKEMTEAQAQLETQSFVGQASNEIVKATFTGDRKLQEITIKAEAVDPEDVEMLQDLVMMAVNDGLSKVEAANEATMGKYTKGIPGL